MKFVMMLAVALSPIAVWAETWTPPEKPDLPAILQEIRADAQKGEYELALAKQVWFHENALKYDPSMSGVRLSFALSYWLDLAKKYPPALSKLKEIRDETRKKLTDLPNEIDTFAVFLDLVALNKYLQDESDTIEAFEQLDARDTNAAQVVFAITQPALIQAKRYTLIDKYLDADRSSRQICENYRLGLKMANERRLGGSKLRDYQVKAFHNNATTLVALLVVNGHAAEAQRVASEFRKVQGDGQFHATLESELEKALQGIVPKPWP